MDDADNIFDVFSHNNALPSTKMITVNKLEPFQLVAMYNVHRDGGGLLAKNARSMIGSFLVGKVRGPLYEYMSPSNHTHTVRALVGKLRGGGAPTARSSSSA